MACGPGCGCRASWRYYIAGVIDGVGPGVAGLAPGDRVMAMTHFPDGAGGYAELVVIDAAGLLRSAPRPRSPTRRPRRWPPEPRTWYWPGLACPAAAARARRQRWCRAVPAPAGRGRRDHHDRRRPRGDARADARPRRCGLHRLHPRGRPRAGPGAGRCGPVDAIADLVGGSLARSACAALRPGGQIAAIATPDLDLDPLLDANITFHGVLIQDDGDRTRALADLLGRRELRPVISRVLPLDAAAEAHRILEAGHAGGKIVLDVTGSL